jgi:hypothetical protein
MTGRTTEFDQCVDLAAFGVSREQRPYIENRLRIAFDAAWNAKTSSILEVLNQMADKRLPDTDKDSPTIP